MNTAHTPLRVLAVDDDPVQLALLKGLLGARGHTVVTAANVKAALDIIQKDMPDLIITDLGLPDASGDVLVRLCASSYGEEGPPVVVVSAHQDEEAIRAALQAGARHYLHKPVRPAELAVLVEHAARKRSVRVSGRPTTVGPYRVLETLGVGGMGTVYLGEDPKGARVALKLLREDMGGEDAQQRLRREVDMLFMLRHPAVVRLLASGRHEGRVYLAMEYVPGLTLGDHVLRKGPLGTAELARMLGVMADALRYLDEVGVVHRDINPRNILVSPAGPRLIDFGISRPAMDRTVTREGLVMGTVAYLAPELLRGAPHGSASDVFALGFTLAEAGLGHAVMPHPVDDLVSRCMALEAGDHRKDILSLEPSPLRDALVKMVAPRPGDRPSAADLARAFGAA